MRSSIADMQGAGYAYGVRTTLNIDDELMCRARRRAADEGITLRKVFEQALRAYLLAQPPRRRKPYRLKWGRAQGGGLQPGVSLDDFEHWHRLRDLMDGLIK